MSKQFVTFHVTWQDASSPRIGIFSDERAFGRAAAAALQERLNQLADEGWIIHDILPMAGTLPKQTAAYTVVAFR